MKQSENVSSSTRKSRKAHHNAPSHIRRKLMSCHLATELKNKHGIRSMPVRKDDEVMVMRGLFKGHSGRVVKVYRKRWTLHIERLNKEKANGQAVPFPIQPSNVQITKLKLDKDRNNLINRKARGTAESKNQKKEKWPGKPGMDLVD